MYKIAQEKKQKAREQEDELRQSISKTVNSNKINPNSVKIILKRIETAIRNLIADSESQATAGKVSFENLGVILHRLGLFQNLEFQATHHGDDHANKSSVSVNQTKVKPQRLTREVLGKRVSVSNFFLNRWHSTKTSGRSSLQHLKMKIWSHQKLSLDF